MSPETSLTVFLCGIILLVAAAASAEERETATGTGEIEVRRTNNSSPAFSVPESDLGFFMNYTGFQRNDEFPQGERFLRDQIAAKALDMIATAEEQIIMSVFLFDSFYAEGAPEIDIVGTITEAFLEKRRTHPEIKIAVILDSSHKSYGQRKSEAERLLREDGIDVFFSDMLSGLKKGSLVGVREGLGHVNRLIDRVTFNAWSGLFSAIFSRAKVPVEFDGDYVSLENAYNAFLLKANHRKLLVTDVGGEGYEALVTSANPHNASAFHINTAVSVKGAAASYIYNVLREDMKLSASLGRNYAHWHEGAGEEYREKFFTTQFPALAIDPVSYAEAGREGEARVTFVTEEAIGETVLKLLDKVGKGDEVRIQMFFLSFQPVVEAILEAATRTGRPVRLLLDANKDSFNREKDGTPNRQVARYLLREAKKRNALIEIRWYSTHGEQNHAKIMTVTDEREGRYLLTTGSCNWTGRNMDGVNMESNIVVDGSPALNGSFNEWFDLFWSNGDGNEYSLDYEAFGDQTGPDWKWKKGEKPFYYSTF